MMYRQKILLALIEAFGGDLSTLDLQHYLFLFTKVCQKEKSYDFVPYKYGCFSFQSYVDLVHLSYSGNLISKKKNDSKLPDWQIKGNEYSNSLKKIDKKKIIDFQKYYADRSREEIAHYIYTQYPYYAINSDVIKESLTLEERHMIDQQRLADTSFCFFTIGYEGTSFEDYLNRLIKNNVYFVCDVRKNALSRKYGFSQKILSQTLNKFGIAYVHFPELGIVSHERQGLKIEEDYKRIFDLYEQTILEQEKQSLQKIFLLLQHYKRVALTCFEADPCLCHRSKIVKAMKKLPDWCYPIQTI